MKSARLEEDLETVSHIFQGFSLVGWERVGFAVNNPRDVRHDSVMVLVFNKAVGLSIREILRHATQ